MVSASTSPNQTFRFAWKSWPCTSSIATSPPPVSCEKQVQSHGRGFHKFHHADIAQALFPLSPPNSVPSKHRDTSFWRVSGSAVSNSTSEIGVLEKASKLLWMTVTRQHSAELEWSHTGQRNLIHLPVYTVLKWQGRGHQIKIRHSLDMTALWILNSHPLKSELWPAFGTNLFDGCQSQRFLFCFTLFFGGASSFKLPPWGYPPGNIP